MQRNECNRFELFCSFSLAQTITVEFKKPWILLAETNISVRSTNDISQQYSEWWCLLNKVRTHFENNPED